MQLNLFDTLSDKFQKKLKKITHKNPKTKKDTLSLKGWLLSYNSLDEEPLTNKNVYNKVIGFTHMFLDNYDLPGRTEIKFDRLRNASYIDNTFEELDSADVALNIEFQTLSGLKIRGEMTVPVKEGKFIEPSLLFIDGNSRIISQSTFDDITKKGTFTRHLFKNPEDIVTPEMLKSYQEIDYPVINTGMYSASKYIMDKVAENYLDKTVDDRIQLIKYGTPELNTVNNYALIYENKIAETNQNWNYDDLYDYVVAGLKKEGMSIDSFEINRLISKVLFRSNQDTYKEVKAEKKQAEEEPKVDEKKITEKIKKTPGYCKLCGEPISPYSEGGLCDICYEGIYEANKQAEEEQKDYSIVSPEETEEIPLMYYFYEYPGHKILDENNNYIAGYQLVIWQGNNYIVTLVRSDIITDKIASGELTLNWEQDAYNADEQSPEVWEDYKKKISNKKESQINEEDIMITPTREGFLFEYRTPEDIAIKKHYVGYEEEEMMTMFLDYIKEEEQKYFWNKAPKVSMKELLADNTEKKEGNKESKTSYLVMDEKAKKQLSNLYRDVDKAKNKLKKTPIVENFGQDEVEKLKDKYRDYLLYEEIDRAIQSFDDWASGYTGKEAVAEGSKITLEESIEDYLDDGDINGIVDYIKQGDEISRFKKVHNILEEKYGLTTKELDLFKKRLTKKTGKQTKRVIGDNQIEFYKFKKATGEPDQDYNHAFFDEIVRQLEEAGFTGATHKEFDKYQGVYLRVPGVDKFWIKDVFYRGEKTEEDVKKPYTKATLIDIEGNTWSASKGDYFHLPNDYLFEGYVLELTKQDGTTDIIENPTVGQLPDITEVGTTFTYKPGTETEIYVFTPENTYEDAPVELEVTNKDGVVDASELIEYCKPFADEPGTTRIAPEDVEKYKESNKKYAFKERQIAVEQAEPEIQHNLEDWFLIGGAHDSGRDELWNFADPLGLLNIAPPHIIGEQAFIEEIKALQWPEELAHEIIEALDETRELELEGEEKDDILKVLDDYFKEQGFDSNYLGNADTLVVYQLYGKEEANKKEFDKTVAENGANKEQVDSFTKIMPASKEIKKDKPKEKESGYISEDRTEGRPPTKDSLAGGSSEELNDAIVGDKEETEEADKMYAEITLHRAPGGFNMWQVHPNAPEYIWDDYTDIISAWEDNGYTVYDLEDYNKTYEDLGIEDIQGRIHNEPTYVYALVDETGEVHYEGIEYIDKSELEKGGSSEELNDAIVGDKEELKWVYGTKDETWHLVSPEDRDYAEGISQEEFKELGEERAKEKYLSPTVLKGEKNDEEEEEFENTYCIDCGKEEWIDEQTQLCEECYKRERHQFINPKESKNTKQAEEYWPKKWHGEIPFNWEEFKRKLYTIGEQSYEEGMDVHEWLDETKNVLNMLYERQALPHVPKMHVDNIVDFIMGVAHAHALSTWGGEAYGFWDKPKASKKAEEETELSIPAFVETYMMEEENSDKDIITHGEDWLLAKEQETNKAIYAYGFDDAGYYEYNLLSEVGEPWQEVFKNAIKENSLTVELFEDEKNYYETLIDAVILSSNKQALWKDKLQNVYESLEEFKSYNEMYGLIERLGFGTAEEAWEANPMIQGTVHPEDYKEEGK